MVNITLIPESINAFSKRFFINVVENALLKIWILHGILHGVPDIVGEWLGMFLISDYYGGSMFKTVAFNIVQGPALLFRSGFLLLVLGIDYFLQKWNNNCFDKILRLLLPAYSFTVKDIIFQKMKGTGSPIYVRLVFVGQTLMAAEDFDLIHCCPKFSLLVAI